MGTLSNFVFSQKIKDMSAAEKQQFLRKENERKMASVRERLRRKEQEQEWERTLQEVFADPPLTEEPVVCVLADEILDE